MPKKSIEIPRSKLRAAILSCGEYALEMQAAYDHGWIKPDNLREIMANADRVKLSAIRAEQLAKQILDTQEEPKERAA